MYYVDSNTFMNGVVAVTLATAVLLLVLSVLLTAARGRGGRGMSYLYMLTAEFACFALVVCVLGFRGQHSGWRPWHFFLDMKYQPKYTPQGESKFFADGRSMRTPVEGTVPFDGTDYAADAGFHAGPHADFLKADPRYYRGLADAAWKTGATPKDPEWKDGTLVEGTFVGRIPDVAVANAGGWDALLKRGREQFGVHCAACHGMSGRGGIGTDAHGIVGAYGLSVAPADVTAALYRSQPDGQLFHTIGHGKGSMPGYGHQVRVADRWAIVGHLRVLQYGRK
jgi:mono/diheme cytochrome c family protein